MRFTRCSADLRYRSKQPPMPLARHHRGSIMNRHTASSITVLAAGLLLLSALDGGAVARGGGGDNGNNHRGNDRQQHGDNNAQHSSDDHKRGGVKNGQSSRTKPGRIAAPLSDTRQAVKPPRMTIHPITNRHPVATTAASNPGGGANKPDASGKTNQTTNSTPAASGTGTTVAVVPPANAIHPIVIPSPAPSAGSAPTASAAPAPVVRDHTHAPGTAQPREGDISVTAGSLKVAPPPIPANAPPAAANPAPASGVFTNPAGNSTARPDQHEALRTVNSKPVASPSTSPPTIINGFDPPPKQGFDIQLSREHRDAHKPQECGAQPGCDISASVRSVGSVAKNYLYSYGGATKKIISGTYHTVKDWF
jgi:hypothetical protein